MANVTLNTINSSNVGYVYTGVSTGDAAYQPVTYATSASAMLRPSYGAYVSVWHVKNLDTNLTFYLIYDGKFEKLAKYTVKTIRNKTFRIEVLCETGISESKIWTDRIDEVIDAELIAGPPRPDSGIKNVYFDEEKATTVVLWKDGTKTIVKCDPYDNFDKEKAIALCYMKKAHDNRACFNETLKEWIEELQ